MGDTDENVKLINAKREARRRKILENANNRLEKLSGKSGNLNENIREVEPIIRNNSVTKTKLETEHKIVNHNEDILQFFSNHGPVRFPDSTPPQSFNNNKLDLHDQNYFSSNIIIQIVNFRLHLIALALISHILYSKKLITISIFYPLLILEIIDFFFLRKFQNLYSSSKLFSTLFLIFGASSLPFNSGKMISVMTVITNILQDISIFLFVFINSHFLTFKVL